MTSMVDKLEEKIPFNSDIEINPTSKDVISYQHDLVEGAGFHSSNDTINCQNSKPSFNCCFKILSVLSFIMSMISMIGVIYLYHHQNHCINTNIIATPFGSVDVDTNNTLVPTYNPTMKPSASPNNEPSPSAINKASPSPTTDQSVAATNYYVGDYKFSAQNKSHNNWLLCDGSFLDPRDYPKLFNIIGNSFGSETSSNEYVELTRFALPNPSDRVIGIDGNKYHIGDKIGQHNMSLRIENIPSHSHPLPLAEYCAYSNYHRPHLKPVYSVKHRLSCDTYFANVVLLNTSASGDGSRFEMYQPTIFVGNLFIYAGDQ